jgi:hypothetical protein
MSARSSAQRRVRDDLLCARTLHDLHAVRSVTDTIGDLKFPHVLHDGRNLRFGHLVLWWHIAVRPMVLPHTQLGRQKKGSISMVSRIVNVMNQRRPFFGTGSVEPMTGGTVRLESRLATEGECRKVRYLRIDCGSLGRPAWPHELPNEYAKTRSQDGKDEVFQKAISTAQVA